MLSALACAVPAGAVVGQGPPGGCLRVERVEPLGAADRAGLRPGDTLCRWRLEPVGAGSTPSSGPLSGPFALGEVDPAGASPGALTVEGWRSKEPLVAVIPTAPLGVLARPWMPPAIDQRLSGALEQLAAADPGGPAALRLLAERCDRSVAAWLLHRGALALEERRLWKDAAELHLEAARVAPELGEQAQLWAAAGVALERAREHARAADCHRQALVRRRSTSPAGPEVATSLHRLGALAFDQGRLDSSAAWFERALAIRSRLGGDGLAAAETLNGVGRVAVRRVELDRARSAFAYALERCERSAPFGAVAAESLRGLGQVAQERGDLALAEQYYRRALELRESRPADPLLVAASLSDLGEVAKRRGDLAAAEELHGRALEIRSRAEPAGLEVAWSLNNLGAVAFMRGDLASAEELFARSLAVKQRLAGDSLDVAMGLSNLGAVAATRGDLACAEGHFRRALSIAERRAPGSVSVAARLSNLGAMYLDRGDLTAAAENLRRALDLWSRLAPDSPDLTLNLNNLGVVLARLGDLAGAEACHRRALAIRERVAPDSLDVAVSLTNLGHVHRDRGEPGQAEACYLRALSIKDARVPGSLTVAATLGALGTVALGRGDLEEAEQLLLRSLEIRRRRAPGTTAEAESLHDLGLVARTAGRREDALGYLAAAVDAVEAQQERLGGSAETRAMFRRDFVAYYRDCLELLLDLGRPEQAFHVLERSRAQAFLLMLAERDLVFSADIPPELDRRRRVARATCDRLAGQLARLSDRAAPDLQRHLLEQLELARQTRWEVDEEVRVACPRLAALGRSEPLTLDGVRANLAPGTVLLAYAVGKRATHLFCVGPGREDFAVHSLPLAEEELRVKVARFRNHVLRNPEPDVLVRVSAALGALLLGPAADALQGAERLLVIPDGPLHLLPFAALADPNCSDRHRYLVEALPLQLAASATVHARLSAGPGRARRQRLAAFGDPRYPSAAALAEEPARRGAPRGDLVLTPLPATRDEVAALAALYRDAAEVWLGEDASEERVGMLGPGPSLVHFACHAFADEGQPLDSALALTIPASSSGNANDGLLRAWEVLERLRLDADLVTLSACETALGAEVAGEGIVGLTRAFHSAGARAVLASLWSVADSSTSVLMGALYRHIRGGTPMAEALRLAQLELLRESVPGPGGEPVDATAPYYWAPFQLYGNPG